MKSAHIHAENSVFDGPVTHLLSVLCIFIEILLRAHAKGQKSHNDFRFGTFIGHFPSDGAPSMAVKGLTGIVLDLLIYRYEHVS